MQSNNYCKALSLFTNAHNRIHLPILTNYSYHVQSIDRLMCEMCTILNNTIQFNPIIIIIAMILYLIILVRKKKITFIYVFNDQMTTCIGNVELRT